MTPKVLLLQARDCDDPMRGHEHGCFAQRCDLPIESIACHDLCDGPPSLEHVLSFDALMIGGSGDYYVSKGNLPHFDGFMELLRQVADRAHPTFASCFGYQCLVQALGGEIIHDPANTEVGTYELNLTEAGLRDPLFGSLPRRFLAQMGHKDRAVRLPEDADNLAASERCPFQALRLRDKPIWASQFHPELTGADNRYRYEHYLENYSKHMSASERRAALEGFRDGPESCRLLRRFLQLVSQ